MGDDPPSDLQGERQRYAQPLLGEMRIAASGRVHRELVIVLELDVSVAGALEQIVCLDAKPLGFLEFSAVVLHETKERVGTRLRAETSRLGSENRAARELPLRSGEPADVEEERPKAHVRLHQQ